MKVWLIACALLCARASLPFCSASDCFEVSAALDAELPMLAGLDAAMAATASLPSATLRLLPSSTPFYLFTAVTIYGQLAIEGNGQIIEFSRSVEVRGNLAINNISIQVQPYAYGFSVFSLAGGSFRITNSAALMLTVTFVSGLGRIQIEDFSFLYCFAPGISLGYGQTRLEMKRTIVISHFETFLEVLSVSGYQEAISISIDQCNFRECQGTRYLIDYGIPYFTGSVAISDTSFSANDIWLMYFDIGAIHLDISGCIFSMNSKVSIILYARGSVVTVTDCKWSFNREVIFPIRQLIGDVVVTGMTVLDHSYKGVFEIRSTLSTSQCRFTLQDAHMERVDTRIEEWSPGVIYGSGCTILVARTFLGPVYVMSYGERNVEGLIVMMMGYMVIRELEIRIAGTTGFGIGVGAGDLMLTDSVLDDLRSSGDIYVGATSGALTVRNVTFTQPRQFYQEGQIYDEIPLYFTGLASRIEIWDVRVLPGKEGWFRFDNVFAAQFSTVNISDILVKDLVIDTIALFKMTDGIMRNITVSNCVLGYTVFSIYCIQPFILSGVSVSDVIIKRMNRGIFAPTVSMNADCSDFTIFNVSTRSIFSSKSGQILMRNLKVTDCSFQYFVYYQKNSNVTIEEMVVRGSTGALAIALYSSLTFRNSLFDGLSASAYMIWGDAVNITFDRVVVADFSNPLSLSRLNDGSNLLIKQSSFSNYRSFADEGFLINSGSVTVLDSYFDTFNVALFQVVGGAATIRNSYFRQIKNQILSEKSNAAYGGVLGCAECSSVTVDSSVFLNVSAIHGGALAVHNSTVIESPWVHIRNCEFVMCSAITGGAVYVQSSEFLIESSRFVGNNATLSGGGLDAYTHSGLRTVIRNCAFFRNSAKEGGAVRWRTAVVALNNVTFQDNSAVYGSNVASYGVKLAGSLPLTTGPAASGYPLQLIFELQDHYGQRVATASTQDLQLLNDSRVSFRGNQATTAAQGVFNYSELTVYAHPNSRQMVEGAMSYVENGLMRTLNGSIEIPFRDCVSGEVRKPDRCQFCFPGNVSFNPADDECMTCPKNAFCPGGNILLVDPHYWRSSNRTPTLLKCPLREACLGGEDSKCAEGYAGQMCNECSSDFTRIRAIQCEKCQHPILLWLKISFVVIPIAGFYTAIKAASDVKLFLLKQGLNHAQLLYTLSYFRISLPAVIKYWLHSLSYISSLYITELPISCLSTYSAEYIRAVIGSGVTPAFCLLLFLLYRRKWKSWVIQCTSALLFIPMISLYTQMSLLVCQTVESEVEWLFLDMREQCWEGTHLLFIKALIVPSVVVNVLLPIVIVCVISIRFPKQFDELFPLWWSGVHWRCWELFIYCTKGVLIGIVVNSIATEQLSQVTYGLLVMIFVSVVKVSISLHAYTHWKLFFLMEHSLVIVAVSMGLCAYYIYHSPSGGVTDWLITGVFVALNAGYFAVCVKLWVFPPDLTKEDQSVVRCDIVPPNSLENSLSDLRHQS